MDLFLNALSQAYTPEGILAVILGVLAGIILGALPGISTNMAITLLFPVADQHWKHSVVRQFLGIPGIHKQITVIHDADYREIVLIQHAIHLFGGKATKRLQRRCAALLVKEGKFKLHRSPVEELHSARLTRTAQVIQH